ncbi:laccase domain protein [Sulfurimicrobium lacus]|uniref:Purine nucleoside phosphorylase n=1 Tax=Sulfurimicrobium lacus TaxID=2715678 RepID=A0A6F8VFM5_9PROT|nr:peptidoglycan editing factor PgeF [Sulfurimicrobium lacus]BCB27752.1 laccase domain protein [Sulfurimicrobium lacus]
MKQGWIVPDWPAPASVHALVTTRAGGVSVAPYACLNLGDHVGDDPIAVAANRRMLQTSLPTEPVWLKQVHGRGIADADHAAGVPNGHGKSVTPDHETCRDRFPHPSPPPAPARGVPAGIGSKAAQSGETGEGDEGSLRESQITADGSVARKSGVVCAVLTADCLPVLLCDRAGTVVAAAHAGWRGLADGVVEAAVAAMAVEAGEVLAWLGPAIGPQAFEVGGEVRQIFMEHDPAADSAFVPSVNAGKWLADIYLLARQRLARIGVSAVYGGDCCTYSDAERFYSYRRDGVTGRIASLVWIDPEKR